MTRSLSSSLLFYLSTILTIALGWFIQAVNTHSMDDDYLSLVGFQRNTSLYNNDSLFNTINKIDLHAIFDDNQDESSASASAAFGGSTTANEHMKSLIMKCLIGVVVYSIMVWTIIGNIFVIIAILTNKQLKQSGMSNFLIGNLAISDLLLGITVLPFSATLTTFKHWVFGKILCDIWLSIDVLCSTASIWSLLVISLDRYIATNHPILYRKQQQNGLRIVVLYCTMAWFISIVTSLAPLMYNSGEGQSGLKLIPNSTDQYECVLFQTPSFVIVSSMLSFYLPLVLMFTLYAGVFFRIRQKSKLLNKSSNRPAKAASKSSSASSHSRSAAASHHNTEARITKTLAIIMGVFVACWLPFFIIYICRSQLSNPESIPGLVMDMFIWLGYFNSALNPVLYAILNANFRTAFQDILACRCTQQQKNSHRMQAAVVAVKNGNKQNGPRGSNTPKEHVQLLNGVKSKSIEEVNAVDATVALV